MTQEISVERHWPLLADYRLGFKSPLTLLESLARNGFNFDEFSLTIDLTDKMLALISAIKSAVEQWPF
jgi:hypothetical protein